METTRRIQVFIITLFVEAGPGSELRGRLRPVRDDHEAHFSRGEELLGLLRQAVVAPETDPGASAPLSP
jgi:hypothetical protein